MAIDKYDSQTLEPGILNFWEKNEIYKKAKDKNKGKQYYYFLDGPPYTSGKVHIGTAWNKSLKDSVLRFKRMMGFDVWDRAGYDMHGLPTEHATEKKLGIKGKEDIEKLGVAKFIEECKTLSKENMLIMNKDFQRLGVWMDFDNAYQSIKNEFIEGEWWLIKKAHEKNRLYLGERTMTWCASCATVVAKHELEYEKVTDKSIFLKFPVLGKDKEFLVIWTTTPWTIPFNMAVMVNPELDYVRAKVDDDEVWIVAKALAGPLIQGVANKSMKIIEEFKGETLEGLKYVHPLKNEIKYFEEIADNPKLHSVVMSSEYVDTTAGSGLVHTAPGCGPEDYEVGHRNGLPPFNHLDEKGVFRNMGKFDGLVAKKDDKKFIEELKNTGCLIAITDVEHDYAHCWRCHEPVVFRTTKQWFFKVEDLKEKLIEENNKIKWIPEAAYNAFNSWLNSLRDNSITKQRYWGTPVPIWKCDKCENYIVVGSLKELEELSKQKLENPHKPWIDEIKIPCSCGGVKHRIPDILDVWVDAGCASWNCLDYPHRKDLFEKMFPADFILEGKDQIRGWFNLLHVASMVSMDKPSFKACYMHGFVQDAQGRKMSKSLGNYILPEEVIGQQGADTLRYYCIGGANPATDLNYNFEDMKLKHKNLMILWNLHKFLIDYSNTIGIKPKNLDENLIKNIFSLEEKYILSKLNSTIEKVTKQINEYLLNDIPWEIEELFLELSRTYIQLVREKSTIGEEMEKQAVLYTIHKVMLETLKLFAPIVPFITEQMYQNLKNEFDYKEESIHLCDWPKANASLINTELEDNVEAMKNIIQSILATREKAQLGVRWPVKEVVIATKEEKVKNAVEKMKDLIMVQTNVKEIKVVEALDGIKELVKADYAKLAPEFKEKSAIIIAKLATDSPNTILSHIKKDGKHKVNMDNDSVFITKEHLIIGRDVPEPYLEGEFRGGLIYLNKERNPELDSEGYSRELTRRIQILRKKSGLEKKDNIALFVKTTDENAKMLSKWQDLIKEKVGASQIKISSLDPSKDHAFKSEEKIKDLKFELFFDKD